MVKKLDMKIIDNKNKFDKKLLDVVKNLQINLTDAYIKIDIGTEDAALTAIAIPFISTIISIVFSKCIKKLKNQKYEVNPVYINEHLININL